MTDLTPEPLLTLEQAITLDANLVDNRSQGFVRDTEQRVQKILTKSVTGLAETALSDINKWREVVMANPITLPFKLPPSLQGDIDMLNSQIAFTGLKIPPLDILQTDLKKTLGNLTQPTLIQANKALGSVLGSAKGQLDRLGQIDWLI